MLLNDKTVGSAYTASEWNEFKNETQNAVESSGQTLASTSVQLKQSMARYAGNADAYIDSGTANAYVLNPIANAASKTNDAPNTYIKMQKCRFVAGNTNTGASTVNIGGIGVKSIKKNGWATALVAGDIIAGIEYVLTYSWSDSSFNLTDTTVVITPANIERGMILSNGTDADHDIDISAGVMASSDYIVYGNLSTTLTKQIDATWADGHNTGGMASGVSLTADTWYHVFELIKPDGTTNAGYDTSITAVNLLAGAAVATAGYTKYRYLEPVLTNGSSNILPGTWTELSGGVIRFLFTNMVNDGTNLTYNTSLTNYTTSTPLGVSVLGLFTIGVNANKSLVFNSNQTPNHAGGILNIGSNAIGTDPLLETEIKTDTSSQIGIIVDTNTTNIHNIITTRGWISLR